MTINNFNINWETNQTVPINLSPNSLNYTISFKVFYNCYDVGCNQTYSDKLSILGKYSEMSSFTILKDYLFDKRTKLTAWTSYAINFETEKKLFFVS